MARADDKKQRYVMAATLVLALIGVRLVGPCMLNHHDEVVNGTVRAEGTPIGSFSFVPDDCASGHELGFWGAEVRAQGGYKLRIVGSADSAELQLYPRGSQIGVIRARKDHCLTWDIDLQWAHGTVGPRRGAGKDMMDGHARATCRAGDGRFTVDLQFANCRD
jgi:hypothetical protein